MLGGWCKRPTPALRPARDASRNQPFVPAAAGLRRCRTPGGHPRSSGARPVVDDDDMDEAGAVGPADVAPLDVGGAARAGDEDGVARLRPAVEQARVVLEVVDDARCVQDYDVVERQEGEQDRRVRRGVDDDRAALGDAQAGKADRRGLVRRRRHVLCDPLPGESRERQIGRAHV